MKNVFYFNLKALFVLKVFKFLSGLFSYVGNQLDKLDKVNFKTYDVANWKTNNYSKRIAQYLKK